MEENVAIFNYEQALKTIKLYLEEPNNLSSNDKKTFEICEELLKEKLYGHVD